MQKIKRLYLFPHAGGSSDSFANWLGCLPKTIEAVPLDIPGRSRFYLHPPEDISITEMARRLCNYINDFQRSDQISVPFAFLGHSMGALLAFETCKQLVGEKKRTPYHLAALACRAPDQPMVHEPYHLLDDENFDAELRTNGGTPQEITDDREMMNLIRPNLRRDIKACETYSPDIVTPLDIPISVIGGDRDEEVDAAELDGWSHHTTRECHIKIFPGGHFFVDDNKVEFAEYISARLDLLDTHSDDQPLKQDI